MPAEPEIDVAILDVTWGTALPDAEAICRRAAAAAVDGLSNETVGISIALADDRLLATLNRDYRGQDKPTNVLSFPADLPEGTEATRFLGDVVLARETLFAEAEAQKKSVTDHLTHLVVHGTLHLMGYDHENDHEAAEMEELETRVLARLGLPDPYSEGPCEGRQDR